MDLEPDTDTELIAYASAVTGLPESMARRLVLDVLSYYDESLPEFVQRRHRELQARGGLKNEQIYRQIAVEVGARRFRVPAPSVRQLRRMIYG